VTFPNLYITKFVIVTFSLTLGVINKKAPSRDYGASHFLQTKKTGGLNALLGYNPIKQNGVWELATWAGSTHSCKFNSIRTRSQAIHSV